MHEQRVDCMDRSMRKEPLDHIMSVSVCMSWSLPEFNASDIQPDRTCQVRWKFTCAGLCQDGNSWYGEHYRY